MCGIVGYVNVDKNQPVDARVVDVMCDTIVHRGPDDHGLFVQGSVGLGMRRLSIIDLAGGHQPITNESKSIWVVFNGEIYNYRELTEWLVARGHVLSTSTDTEVIVHLYEELGDECVHRLRGMFVFALWDQNRERLLIARDRLGVKPLYYFWDEKVLVFGSELKALLAHPAVRRELDPLGVLYFLRYSYIPDPLSVIDRVSKLPPGHLLTVAGCTLSVRPYWDVRPTADHTIEEREALETLESLLQESVRLRLVSDVPLGAFLSGGIDSSVVVAMMAREMSRPVKTFSIGFEEAAYNELPFARKVAQHIGAEHHELILGPQGCHLIHEIVRHCDEPLGDPSAIPTYLLSKLTSEHVTVALSGDGGDELFAGYDRYRMDLDRQRFEVLPHLVKRVLDLASDVLPDDFPGKRWLRSLTVPPRQRYMENISYSGSAGLRRIVGREFFGAVGRDQAVDDLMQSYFRRVEGAPWLAQLQYLDTKTYLPGDVLAKVDRMSMAHSLEARNPFLDHVLVEYVMRLPVSLKLRHGVSKYLLKRLAEKLIPSDVVYRKKQGFGIPLEHWFRGRTLKDSMHELLFDGRLSRRGIFAVSEVQRLVTRYEQGRTELATMIWMLMVFETWCRTYLDDAAFLRCGDRPVPGPPSRNASCASVV